MMKKNLTAPCVGNKNLAAHFFGEKTHDGTLSEDKKIVEQNSCAHIWRPVLHSICDGLNRGADSRDRTQRNRPLTQHSLSTTLVDNCTIKWCHDGHQPRYFGCTCDSGPEGICAVRRVFSYEKTKLSSVQICSRYIKLFTKPVI